MTDKPLIQAKLGLNEKSTSGDWIDTLLADWEGGQGRLIDSKWAALQARNMIADTIKKLSPQDGFVVVPKEPTGEMVKAGEDLDQKMAKRYPGLTSGASVGQVYAAMIKAALEK